MPFFKFVANWFPDCPADVAIVDRDDCTCVPALLMPVEMVEPAEVTADAVLLNDVSTAEAAGVRPARDAEAELVEAVIDAARLFMLACEELAADWTSVLMAAKLDDVEPSIAAFDALTEDDIAPHWVCAVVDAAVEAEAVVLSMLFHVLVLSVFPLSFFPVMNPHRSVKIPLIPSTAPVMMFGIASTIAEPRDLISSQPAFAMSGSA